MNLNNPSFREEHRHPEQAETVEELYKYKKGYQLIINIIESFSEAQETHNKLVRGADTYISSIKREERILTLQKLKNIIEENIVEHVIKEEREATVQKLENILK